MLQSVASGYPQISSALETLALSAFSTKTEEFLSNLMMHIQDVVQDTWIRPANPTQRSRSTRSRPHNLPLRILLATTLALVTVLVSFSICKDLFSRYHFSGLTPRRLSERGESVDEGERGILEGCLDMEEELGIMSQRTTSSPEGDASTRIMELMSMLSETAEEKESMQGDHPLEGKLHSSQQLLEGPSVSEQRDGIPLQTSSLQTSVKRAGSTDGDPALDPDSWIDAIPSIDVQLEGQEGAESPPATDDESDAEEPSETPLPKRKRTGDLVDLLLCDDPRAHPYVRLPVLEENVTPRYIHEANLFVRPPGRLSPHVYLREIRRLFRHETLSQYDTDVLMKTVERLVSVSWFSCKPPSRKMFPVDIVSVLGKYFMIFDAIVCCIELLGEYMQPDIWWDKFASSFDTNFHLSSHSPYVKSAQFHLYLAKRLMAALEIYKKGMRPPRAEVYDLKRLLFCSPLGSHRLKEIQWDPWREDGGC